MNQRRFGLRAASGLSLFLAVAVFALMALLTVVLGAGDAFHLIPRAYALCTTGLEHYTVPWAWESGSPRSP